MSLGELIAALEAADPRLILPDGFHNPHSYRGYYEQLAFEPAQNVTVGAMLADARSALGAVYEGYKGGSYRMVDYTDCWIAEYGSTGDGDMLSPMLVRLMLATGRLPADPEPEPDPSDPRQIAAHLIRRLVDEISEDKVRAHLMSHYRKAGIKGLVTDALVTTVHDLIGTAEITWPEVTT